MPSGHSIIITKQSHLFKAFTSLTFRLYQQWHRQTFVDFPSDNIINSTKLRNITRYASQIRDSCQIAGISLQAR